jgi:general L-amino acid transport system substrate-binding protein
MKGLRSTIAAGIALGGVMATQPALAGPTFDAVRQRGTVVCGVNTSLAGFSIADAQGVWHGLDVDLCRAIAAAMFGDANRTRYVPLTAQQRFVALQAGEIDVLLRNSTVTVSRDTALGLNYTGINFYDGQAFMVGARTGANRLQDLNGATVCVATGTTHEMTIADWSRAHNVTFQPLVFENQETMYEAFFSGRCDVVTQDASALAAALASRTTAPGDYRILPDRISKEPLGPFVRNNDNQWFNVVRNTLNAMIDAEELGVTQANVDEALRSSDPEVQRMLGVTGEFGRGIGLDNRWAYNVIRQVGNYGDSFERNVGRASPLRLERGINGLWTQGGLMYAMPFR